MTKISVVTPTARPWPKLLDQASWLMEQTFPHGDFEWIIIDDLHADRAEWFAQGARERQLDLARVLHCPPLEITPYFNAIGAVNTALRYAQGELLYMMVDNIQPTPRVLERHWEIYQSFGPQVFIGGPLADIGSQGQVIPYNERTYDVRMGPHLGRITSDHYISRFAWFGWNDSVSLEAMLAANGMDERMEGMIGGADVELAMRLTRAGYCFLLDLKESAYRHPKPPSKPKEENPIWSDLVHQAMEGGSLWAPNARNIREDRAKLYPQEEPHEITKRE